jgi:hypothetical protein
MDRLPVVFLLTRGSSIRLVLPIIKGLIDNSTITPTLICYSTANDPYTPSVNPFDNSCNVHFFQDSRDFSTLMTELRPKALLSNALLRFPDLTLDASIDLLRRLGTAFYYLQYASDPVTSLPTLATKHYLFAIAGYFFFSGFWKDQFLSTVQTQHFLDSEENRRLKSRTFISGPHFMEPSSIGRRADICKRYGLDHNRRYIFFDPPGYSNSVPNFFYKYYFHKSWYSRFTAVSCDLPKHWRAMFRNFPSSMGKLRTAESPISQYPKLLKELRQFADRHDCLIISKVRKKHKHPDFVYQSIDHVSYDESFYPFTLHELLFISESYFGFNSTASIEAVALGCPVILFQIFPEIFRYAPYGGNVYSIINRWLEHAPSPFNFPGAVDVCLWNQSSQLFLEKREICTLDEQTKRNFIDTYVGSPQDNTAVDIFSVILDD